MGEISYELMEEIMTKEEKTFYAQLGERVAALRKESHTTQVQMAKALGVSQQQVASYEAGRVKIPVSKLPVLSDLLAAPLEVLLGLESRSKRGPASRLQKKMEQLAQLPRSKQKFVLEMLDGLISQQRNTG